MAEDFDIRPATLADAHELAPRMRLEEVREVEASAGFTPLQALLECLQQSDEAWSGLWHGEVAFMFGVAQMPGCERRIGAAWLLTSPLVERHARAFWRAGRAELPRLLEQWEVLCNAIDARHEKALRWAGRLGFSLEPAQPFGAAGLPFHVFTVTREELHV